MRIFQNITLLLTVITILHGETSSYMSTKFSNLLDNKSSIKIALLPVEGVKKYRAKFLREYLQKCLKDKQYIAVDLSKINRQLKGIKYLKKGNLSAKASNRLLELFDVDGLVLAYIKPDKKHSNNFNILLEIYGKNRYKLWYSSSKKSNHNPKITIDDLLSSLPPAPTKDDIVDDSLDNMFENATIIKTK